MKIVVVAGSLREASYNRLLAEQVASFARAAGAEVQHVDLREFPLPLFNEDEEAAGFPENAKKLKSIFQNADGWIVASPEYNSSLTAVLKNLIDWLSRPESESEKSLAVYQNKIALLLSASPGALGGLRGLVHLRSILENVGVVVLPSQKAIPQAYEAFDQQGKLKDAKLVAQLTEMTKSFLGFVKAHSI